MAMRIAILCIGIVFLILGIVGVFGLDVKGKEYIIPYAELIAGVIITVSTVIGWNKGGGI